MQRKLFFANFLLQFLWLLLASLPLRAQPPAGEAPLRATLDAIVQPVVDDKLIGCVVGVVTPTERLVLSYGSVQPAGPAPDGKTLYEIGSVSKVFTGTLLADANLRGELTIDDQLASYLPEGIELKPQEAPITLRHLATHRSGLPRLPPNMLIWFMDPTDPYRSYTDEMAWKALAGYQPPRAPGSYEYSNYGMGLLGMVVERAAHTPYEVLLRERITDPLGMSDTTIELSAEQQQRFAPAHFSNKAAGRAWTFDALVAAGGIRSTADDLIKLIDAVISARRADPKLPAEPVIRALALATTLHSPAEETPRVGLGWHGARDGVSWVHAGMTGGYTAYLAVTVLPKPERYAGVVVLSNIASDAVTPMGEQALVATLKHVTQRIELPIER
ncbi:serine hydrolase domain-containing protein [Botrimarina hoheduenensis]|uniref:Beta-lactamase n=1 Tax=Botrimarina hoheduenensis TaxID=2528000 RepID=A0A5C5W9Q9_9BACT|nr:serine hydrolase domain-containing protein [Botrimarina hoheduenensis]TWT47608.1 D-alanyl-D-alanine-carboxypeptidase/endopeptidase AmpH precursor [Botrimarina hoheduenensis]